MDDPSDAWKSALNTTCNRLSNQYLNLLRSSSESPSINASSRAIEVMIEDDEPPPALAASVNFSALQAKIASQNICIAASQLLDLIRTLRISGLLMDKSAIRQEETIEINRSTQHTERIVHECRGLEMKLMNMWNEHQ